MSTLTSTQPQRRHIGVAVTDGRLDVIQPVELARAQFDRVGTDVLLDPFASAVSSIGVAGSTRCW